MRAHLDEGGGRIVLGNDTGDGAITLWRSGSIVLELVFRLDCRVRVRGS